MCGIAGIIASEQHEALGIQLRAMLVAMRHRGPDGEGSWIGQVGRFALALGHLRLAIIDLSDAGQQPLILPDRSGLIIFNGEIYNYLELRAELEGEGVIFRTRTDTEVLLWALQTWGEAALTKLNGMWALAWLDLRSRRLMLSRDRFGIKPLYYYREGSQFWFASEIKGILAAVHRRFPINAAAAGRFLMQSLLDAQSQTFFEGIEALPAGHSIIFDLRANLRSDLRIVRYWYPQSTDSLPVSEEQCISTVRETFFDAVRIRLRSDVPVGVLLSGGVDSSSIATAMRELLGPKADLRLLAAISGNPRYDERPFMDMMGHYLASPVSFVTLERSPQEWFSLLNEVIYANDEPVGNFSTVAHFLLMQEARNFGITVILSGQGADELLCGYRKFLGFRLQELVTRGNLIQAAWLFAGFLGNRTVLNQFELGEAKRYISGLPGSRTADIRGPRLMGDEFMLDNGLDGRSLVERQLEDVARLSVPALVHYEDRCSMSWAREIRLPFLDYRMVNLLLPADPDLKLRDGWTKWIFRKAMEPFLPGAIAWRKDKQNFTNPQKDWLRNELRSTISELLAGDLLIAQAGLVDRDALHQRYKAYCDQRYGRGSSFKDVFNPIALELWARRFEPNLAIG